MISPPSSRYRDRARKSSCATGINHLVTFVLVRILNASSRSVSKMIQSNAKYYSLLSSYLPVCLREWHGVGKPKVVKVNIFRAVKSQLIQSFNPQVRMQAKNKTCFEKDMLDFNDLPAAFKRIVRMLARVAWRQTRRGFLAILTIASSIRMQSNIIT